MPLPRFQRLPAEEQRRILDVALETFAADGADAASYNQIIATAGISRSSAYNYFDGRDDLLRAVLDEVAKRFGDALGSWSPAADPAEFWSELEASTERVAAHIEKHPADVALVDVAFLDSTLGRFSGWIEDLVANGVELGLVTVPLDRELIVAATTAVLPAFDGWTIEQLRAGRSPSFGVLRTLLSHLWGAPDSRPRIDP